MSEFSNQPDPSQKRGRTFLCSALVMLGALLMHGFSKGVVRGEMNILTALFNLGFYGLLVVLAFRGGRLSLSLLKGCAGFLALLCAVLLIVAGAAIFRGQPMPETPGVRNSLEFFALLAGAVFCVWALFFSRDVKAFLTWQRAVAHERAIRAVRRQRSDGNS